MKAKAKKSKAAAKPAAKAVAKPVAKAAKPVAKATKPAAKAAKPAAKPAKVKKEVNLDKVYGKVGTKKRADYELKVKASSVGDLIKKERIRIKMTQDELALKTDSQKSFISRIENGHNDIQLSTLFRLVEQGLGKEVKIKIK
jgi:ribosome-binding protein aMBF1 (putative translation factor)